MHNRLIALFLVSLGALAAPPAASAQWDCGGGMRSTYVELVSRVSVRNGSSRSEPLDRHVTVDEREEIFDLVHEYAYRYGIDCGYHLRVTIAYDATTRVYSADVAVRAPDDRCWNQAALIRITPPDGGSAVLIPSGPTALASIEEAVSRGSIIRPDTRISCR